MATIVSWGDELIIPEMLDQYIYEGHLVVIVPADDIVIN